MESVHRIFRVVGCSPTSMSRKVPPRFVPAIVMIVLAVFIPAAGFPREFKDSVGRVVDLPERAERIVSLAPNITEILFAVGAGPQIVGVTGHCDYPPEAAALPRIGGFVNPSLEVVASLKPDLIIGTADGNRPADILGMEKIGLKVYVIDTRSINDIFGSIRVIGQITGHEQQAREVLAEMARQHEEIMARPKNPVKARVLFLVGLNPPVGVGPGTFIHHLIEQSGGVNVLDSSLVKYPLLSMESILAADPDVIIVDVMGEGTVDKALPAGWERLRAVREGKVHRLQDETLLRPGPRIMHGLSELERLIYTGTGVEP